MTDRSILMTPSCTTASASSSLLTRNMPAKPSELIDMLGDGAASFSDNADELDGEWTRGYFSRERGMIVMCSGVRRRLYYGRKEIPHN